MKVLLPTHEIQAAGIGTAVEGLARSLPAALASSDELVLAGLRPDGLDAQNVQVLESPRLVRTRLGRFLYEQTVIAAKARDVDLVHLGNPRPLFANRKPFILTVPDMFVFDRPDWYPESFARFKRSLLAVVVERRPRAVACLSEYTRERLLTHYPGLQEGLVSVIYPGPPSLARSAPPAAPDESDFFLTVATVEPRKNHLGLLEAFRLARARGLRLRWKIAGGQGYHSRWILPALMSQAGIDYLGYVSPAEQQRLYERALFFAFPSHAEGFGFPPLEAMAHGVPTICSEGTAMDETVGDAALRVPSGDTRAWAEALRLLASDPGERQRLRRRGLERARRFSWAAAAAAYVERYRDALAS